MAFLLILLFSICCILYPHIVFFGNLPIIIFEYLNNIINLNQSIKININVNIQVRERNT